MAFSAAGPSDTDSFAAGPSGSGRAKSFSLLILASAKRCKEEATSRNRQQYSRKKSIKDPAGIESNDDLYSKYCAYLSQSRIPGPQEKQLNQRGSKVPQVMTNMFGVSLIEEDSCK